MKKTFSTFVFERNARAAFAATISSFMVCLAAIADPGGVADLAAGTYTIDCAAAYTVTADDVAAAEGLDIVKKGNGTVTAGAVMASFDGEIRIEEGIWFVNDNGGLGTGAGGTVVSNGAALHFKYNGQNKLKFAAGESLTIVGTGPDGKGALYNASVSAATQYEQNSLLAAGNCKFELSGNATIGGDYNFGLGGGTARLNGHRLTLKMKNVAPFNITCDAIETAGDIRIEKGRLFFRSGTEWGGCETNVIHAVSSDSQVAFNSVANPIPYKLVMEAGSRLYPSSPKPFSTKHNIWAGPIVLNGSISLAYNGSEATGVTLSGPISGSGGITVSGICRLNLSCPTNEFTGALTVKNGAVLYVAENGSVPANGDGINGEDGATVVFTGGDMALPASTFAGGVVSNAVVGSKATFAGITKTGEGTLDLVGGIEVANADVQAGDVKFGKAVPVSEYAGIYTYSTNFATQADMLAWWPASKGPSDKNSTNADWLSAANKLKGEIEPELVEYPGFAYSAWPVGYQLYVADGYFRSSEPTNAVFTFTTSIADMAAVWIDGTCILRRGSSATIPSELRSSDNASTHFISSGTLTLAPGPHQFLFVSGHYGSSGRGPRAQKLGGAGISWAANFGIGWRLGTDEPDENYPDALLHALVSSSNYSAVSNTAETVVVTPGAYYTAAEVTAKPGRYAPSFVSATFANGTALDLGDVAPYCGAAVIGNLTGTPTVSNGSLILSGTFAPTVAGLAAQPLTLDGATLTFGDGATLSLPSAHSGEAVRTAYAPAGSSIVNTPSPSTADGTAQLYRRCLVETVGEGATALDLLPVVGLRFIVH